MELLKQRIISEGKIIGSDILKVDSFLNHQMDIELFNEMGKEFKRIFGDDRVTRILTIEASGIGIACITAQYFNVPVVFAKKTEARNLDVNTFESEVYSFTKGKSYKIKVAKKYLEENDRVLIIDDFLANGNAVLGLADIIKQAGAHLAGAGIVIEKGFQCGRKKLEKSGIRVESLAIIKSMHDGQVTFG